MMDGLGQTPLQLDAEALGTHAIRVIIPFRLHGKPGPDSVARAEAAFTRLTLSRLAAGSFRLISPDRANRAEAAVFTRTEFPLGDDLHEAVCLALGAGVQDGARRCAPCLALTPAGRALVNGDSLRPPGDPATLPGFRRGSGLRIALGKRAQERMPAITGRSPEILLSVDSMQVLVLTSGIGLVVTTLSLGGTAPTLSALQEAVHAISHARRSALGWACIDGAQLGFSLHGLVAAILVGVDIAPLPANRLFTYSFAHLATSARVDLPVAAWRLSRHYTSDYAPPSDMARHGGTIILQPFVTITHAASLEGLATLVGGDGEHASHAAGGTLEQRYVVLALLAYHEYVLLLGLAQQAAGSPDATIGAKARHAEDTVELAQLMAHFLLFRRRFRIALASEVTMHNQAYEAFRGALCNDSLERKMREDVAEAARHLELVSLRARKHVAAAREHARAPFEGLLAFMLTFLTSMAAVKEVRTIVGEYVHIDGARWFGAVMFGVCFVMAGIAGWYATSRHRDSHDVDGLEGLDEHLRHEAIAVSREAHEESGGGGHGH